MSDAFLMFKRAPGLPQAQSVSASPSTYQNSSPFLQSAIIVGGIVTTIEVDNGSGFAVSGLLAGTFPLFPSNQIRVTYAVSAPTLNTVAL